MLTQLDQKNKRRISVMKQLRVGGEGEKILELKAANSTKQYVRSLTLQPTNLRPAKRPPAACCFSAGWEGCFRLRDTCESTNTPLRPMDAAAAVRPGSTFRKALTVRDTDGSAGLM